MYLFLGPDHGCFEHPYNSFMLLHNSTDVQLIFTLFCLSVFAYNILAMLVTYNYNSVWHAILDNFRYVSVWGVDLAIHYCINGRFGESWTNYCFLQLVGMFVLIYGTAVYNAPNPGPVCVLTLEFTSLNFNHFCLSLGSIKLTGGVLSCFLDFSAEYDYEELLNSSAGEEEEEVVWEREGMERDTV